MKWVNRLAYHFQFSKDKKIIKNTKCSWRSWTGWEEYLCIMISPFEHVIMRMMVSSFSTGTVFYWENVGSDAYQGKMQKAIKNIF